MHKTTRAHLAAVIKALISVFLKFFQNLLRHSPANLPTLCSLSLRWNR